MPKISVIVPVYGVEKFIERCARCLFEQTLDDIEYLFIDDCSPDRSVEILKQILNVYPKRKGQVVIHRMEHNSGQAKVREWGAKNATGEYIIHCDSDDWVDTNLYRAMYEKAKDDESDVVVCDFCIHDGEKKISELKGSRTLDKKEFIQRLLLQETSWSLCNKLFKRDLYESFVDSYPVHNMGEDMVITLQLMQGVRNISYIDSEKYYYFSNYNSISKSPSVEAVLRKFEQYQCNYRLIKEKFERHGLFEEYKKEFIWLEYSVKAMLDDSDHRCRVLWKKTSPYIEYKVLFNRMVSFERKKKVVKAIIKHLL